MRLALFEPDIPQNAGAMMRLAAGLGIALDLIEPCGFVLDDRRLRRSLLDYLQYLDWTRHPSWQAFERWREGRRPRPRLLALTVDGETAYTRQAYRDDDIVLVGRESAGLPSVVRQAVDARLRVPMAVGPRSLNVATAAAMVIGEGLRQTRWTAEDDA